MSMTIQEAQFASASWAVSCFGDQVVLDKIERGRRLVEEALELGQAVGLTATDCNELVDYVFSRPVGEPSQEVAGVMTTLLTLSHVCAVSASSAFDKELARISQPEMMQKIRQKQISKQIHSNHQTVSAGTFYNLIDQNVRVIGWDDIDVVPPLLLNMPISCQYYMSPIVDAENQFVCLATIEAAPTIVSIINQFKPTNTDATKEVVWFEFGNDPQQHEENTREEMDAFIRGVQFATDQTGIDDYQQFDTAEQVAAFSKG